MPNNKTIKINPELFSLTKPKKKSNKEKSITQKKKNVIKPNTIKTKLLERIKAHKLREKELKPIPPPLTTNTKEAKYENEFNDSMSYLSNLAQQRNQIALKNKKDMSKTLKNKYSGGGDASQQVQLEIPHELKEVPLVLNVPENEHPIQLNNNKNNVISGGSVNNHYKIDNSVPYGCLKGGLKPTYKSWNSTLKIKEPIKSTISIDIDESYNPISDSVRENKLKELKHKYRANQQEDSSNIMMTQNLISTPTQKDTPIQSSPITPFIPAIPTIKIPTTPTHKGTNHNINNNTIDDVPLDNMLKPPKRYKKTIRRKYTLGRSNDHTKIGVLIKNKTMRKKVLEAHKEIKKKGINDIKQYLRTHGLIKVGSNAPNDVVRKIYESSMLSGEITNIDQDVLLHNFMKDEYNQ